MNQNPFTVLTLIVAPAVLTNASSVLALSTVTRLARAVDRAKELSAQLDNSDTASEASATIQLRQLKRVQQRALLLVRALTSFYLALSLFAATSLISLLGASLASSSQQLLLRGTLGATLATGIAAVAALMIGCLLLVRETRLAVLSLNEEAELARSRYEQRFMSKE